MPKGNSLHIGLNWIDKASYAGWDGALQCCEADAEAAHQIAVDMGYAATLLLTSDATLHNVTESIRAAASRLRAGDIFFLSYAGHGGQLPDQGAGSTYRDEDDRIDETWCLYDGQLSDDEQSNLYACFPSGVRILVVSDSCHSGTVTRGGVDRRLADMNDADKLAKFGVAEPRFRFMPKDVARSVYSSNREFYTQRSRSLPEPRPTVTAAVQLLAGCQDDQLSREGFAHGYFTEEMLAQWNNGKFDGTYADFYQAILSRMPDDQKPNWYHSGARSAAFETQRPFSI